MYKIEGPNKIQRSCISLFTIAFVEEENAFFGRLQNPLHFICSKEMKREKKNTTVDYCQNCTT
jgi:hypothetical protein